MGNGLINAAQTALENGARDKVALECGDTRVTYGELRARVARAAGAWRQLGLASDQRAIVFAPDGIDWVEAHLGAIWAGGVAIGVNPRLSMADLAPIVAESGVHFVWTTPQLAPAVSAMARTLAVPLRVVAAGGGDDGCDWSACLAQAAEMAPVPRSPRDMALWIGTSGTTGTPKGVIHTQSVTAPCGAFAAGVLGATENDRFYATSKLFFAYALANSLFAGLRLGATVILDGEWPTPARVAEMAQKHRPTLLFCVPTLYHKMLQAGVAPQLAALGIRHYVSAGEALPPTVRARWAEATSKNPVSGYGTSETLCLMLYCDDGSGLLKPTPLTEVHYNDVAPAVPQRIWVRHPAVARGYWQRPEADADGFRQGWFQPGDMFVRRDDGRLEFTGRNDDLLKIAGQWVSTQWVEQALRTACGDAVQEVAAVGVKAADQLSAVSVFLVATPGCEDEARRQVVAGIESLPGHKRPRWVHWVDSLPLTPTGKLQRSRLGALHEASLGKS